jgi:integrase
LSLQNKDVNLSDNYLVLRDSKNGKERMIPISDSLSGVCKEYQKHRDLLPFSLSKNDYFFVSLNGSVSKSDIVYRWFQKILGKAGIRRDSHGPRLHDLRHTFSVHALATMAESGIDLYCSLPILSTYLGHQSLEATNSYVRLTSEMYPGLLKDVNMICFNVFPNVESHEAN